MQPAMAAACMLISLDRYDPAFYSHNKVLDSTLTPLYDHRKSFEPYDVWLWVNRNHQVMAIMRVTVKHGKVSVTNPTTGESHRGIDAFWMPSTRIMTGEKVVRRKPAFSVVEEIDPVYAPFFEMALKRVGRGRPWTLGGYTRELIEAMYENADPETVPSLYELE